MVSVGVSGRDKCNFRIEGLESPELEVNAMKKLIIALLLSGFMAACTANATEYTATVDSVYDGDTVKVTVEIWPGLFQKISVRIKGIDTPETRTRNACEKTMAIKAKAALKSLIGEAVLIDNVQLGKYAGRVLADMRTMPLGIDVGEYMIGSGFAREYNGGKRKPWCVERLP